MKAIVLLIDTNPAVQAMCALALTNLPIELKVSSDPAHARKIIEEENPDIILCSADIAHFDIFSYVKELRTSGNATTCFFAALVSNDLPEEIDSSSLFDAILKKPFKSEKLSTLVSGAILTQKEKAVSTPRIAVINAGALVSQGLKSILGISKAKVSLVSKEEVIHQPALPFTACICDAKNMTIFSWYSEELWGPLIVLLDESNNGKLPDRAEKLSRPLTLKALSSKLSKWHSLPEVIAKSAIKRTKTEQAELAARLGAELFQKLIISNEIVEGAPDSILSLSKSVLEEALSKEK